MPEGVWWVGGRRVQASECPIGAQDESKIVQTAFTSEQLAQPAIAEADGILKTCVHYGLYRDLSNLCSVPRRERLAARPHRPHSRHAGKGWRAGRQDRSSPRSMPFLPFLHDDLRGEGGLRPSDRYRPRVYRGELPETFRRARAAAHDRGTAPVPAPLRDGSATCEAVTAIRRRSAPSTAQFDRAGIRPADGRRVPASGRLPGERPTQNARRLARGLRAADA